MSVVVRLNVGPVLGDKDRAHSKANSKELKTVLEALAGEWPNGKKVDRALEKLSIPQMEEMIRSEYPDHVDALHTAKEMFQEAKIYLESDRKITIGVRDRLRTIIDGIIRAIESIINAFGISSLFKPSENEFQTDMRAQKIMMLISLFAMLSSLLIPVAGPALVGMILGGTLLGIAALSLIFPLIKPTPSEIPCGENWTKECQLGRLTDIAGRKKEVDAIADVLISSTRAKTHPMLIGKSGVGKTETLKALVHAIERGEYPELKGKRIIYFNTADLVNNSEMFQHGNRILSRIKDAIGRYGDRFILVFDEIHLACQKKEQSAIGDQLKTMLDPGTGSFPHCIGVTTEEDYYKDIYRNHAAFARRFKRINIEKTNPDETLQIICSTFLRTAPKTLLDPGALRQVVEKTEAAYPDAPQPSTALKILAKCIQKTNETQKSDLDLRMETVRDKIASLYTLGAVSRLIPYQDGGRREEIQRLERELAQLEGQFERERGELEQLVNMREDLLLVKRKICQLALKVSRLKPGEKAVKEFLFLSHFAAPSIETKIRSEANRLGVKAVLNGNLIDESIREEQEMERRVQQAIEQGRDQLQARD